jgi:hypothetical protein
LTGGLYGALIVLEPGERYNPETDHIFIISLDGIVKETEREPIVLNGGAGRHACGRAQSPAPHQHHRL